MNPILIDALIDLLAFLELSGDDVVNPDSAVQAMESAAATLQKLSPEDRRVFIDHLHHQTDVQRKRGADQERVKFLESLAGNIGLNE